MVPGGASLAQHPAVSQGKINEEHDGEEDPACGDMEARNDFRDPGFPSTTKEVIRMALPRSMAKRPAQ